jgi:small subunit ribosomal protein S1
LKATRTSAQLGSSSTLTPRPAGEAHKKQVAQHAADDAAAATSGDSDSGTTSYSSEPAAAETGAGTLASDEALAALREKLTGN